MNKKLLKEEEAVLENPAKKSYIEKIVQGPRRPIPAKGKAILVSAIFFKEGNITSQLPHLKLGSKTVLISETIRDKSWLQAIELWLRESTFNALTRAIGPAWPSWRAALAFMVILRGFKDVSEECEEHDFVEKTRAACNAIVEGKTLRAQYLKRFTFLVLHESSKLEAVKQALERNELLKKKHLNTGSDLLIVFSSGACHPFNRMIESSTDDQLPTSSHEESAPREDDGSGDEVESVKTQQVLVNPLAPCTL